MTLQILFLAAEAEPFVKIGGLGDVAGALPKTLQKASETAPNAPGLDIRVALPYHDAIKKRGFDVVHLGEFPVRRGREVARCQVYQSDQGTLPVYLLDGPPINEESPVYSSDPVQDGYKYVFFSLAALGLADFLQWRVDVLMANDWHTATAVYALNKEAKRSRFLRQTKTVHILHNLPFMGVGAQQALTDYGLPPTRNPDLPEWARHIPLPLGLLHADRIIAVSPHYAQEILTPEFGCGLQDFLQTRQAALTGILNGLNTDTWNPEDDPAIEQLFSIETLSDRIENKRALQRMFQLEERDDLPLLTLVSRMDPQKGIDIALRGLRACEQENWQAIILGTGQPAMETLARDLAALYPQRVRSVLDFDARLAHQLYAGADIFMMPSRYEPCGLSQMIAMRYGCVPIARATGGLVDTIQHVSRVVNGGTGFLFTQPYPSAFARVLRRALRLYRQPETWRQIQTNGMLTNFSWEKSARQYLELLSDLAPQ